MSITAKLKQRTKQLTADIPAVFLAMKDRRTPPLAKILAAIAVAYALSPIDLIPDFIPVIGNLDDVLLLPILIVAAVKLIPEQVWADCKSQAENLWDGGTGTMTAKMYGGSPADTPATFLRALHLPSALWFEIVFVLRAFALPLPIPPAFPLAQKFRFRGILHYQYITSAPPKLALL